jgi:hypothetical protein
MSSIILEIQATATSAQPDTAVLLRKAKLAATKLNESQATSWISSEMDGYTCHPDELPSYRRLYGELRARNPYNGLIPLETRNAELEQALSFAPVFQGIASIEDNLRSQDDDAVIQYTLGSKKKKWLYEHMNLPLEPVLQLHRSQLVGLVNAVVSKILDWSLELERAGVLGEGMSFTMDEKKSASPITQNFFGSNIGQVGVMHDSARVQIGSQSAAHHLDQQALIKFMNEVELAKSLLPREIQEDVSQHIESLRNEPSEAGQRKLLVSLRSILEGAAGGVFAQGIIVAIGSMLG